MKTKIKILISVAVVLAITGLIVYFIIIPTLQDIQSIEQAIHLERVDLEKKYLKGQLLNKTIENFERIKPEKDKLMSIFINENQELEFITEMETIAAANNIKQEIRLQSNQIQEDFYFYLPLEINSQGSFADVLRYLRAIESLSYYFNINTLDITAGQNRSPNDPISITFGGRIYGVSLEEKNSL